MTTFRRDKLRRLAEQGRLMMVDSYHFDGQGGGRDSRELPVRMLTDGRDWKEGWCNVRPGEFDGNSGRAYLNPNGTVTLIVHSNSNMTFRILPEGETAQPLPPPPAPAPAAPLPPPLPTRITAPFTPVVGQRLIASFAKLNKRRTLSEYREECRFSSDYHEEQCEVEAVRTLSSEEYDHLVQHLMDNVDWLGRGKGGTCSDADLPEDWEFHTGTEAERAAFRAKAYNRVTVIQAPGRETFVIDAQEYDYARYVGLDPVPVSASAPPPPPAPVAMPVSPPPALTLTLINGFVGERIQSYKVRNQCGHVETRPMRPSTAGVAYDPAAEWQIEPQSDCVDCQKMKAAVRQAQSPPVEGQIHCYHPEMYEERAESRILHTRHVWKSFYGVEWAEKDHDQVLALFKQLRVRPCKRGEYKEPIELSRPGEGGYLGKVAKYSCLVTSAAMDKLGPYASHEILLD